MKLKLSTTTKFNEFNKTVSDGLKISKFKFIPVYILIFIVFVVLTSNLFSMQIVDGSEYLAASNQNYKGRNILRAPRGVIYDFNGKRIAYNDQAYTVYVDTNEFDFEKDGQALAQIIGMKPEDLQSKLENTEEYAGRVTLRSNLSHDDYLKMVNRISNLEGVYSTSETHREYIDNYIYSHIVGYIGDASLEDLSDRIDEHSRLGKTGLESMFDLELRGKDGVQVQEIDINSGKTKTYIPNTSEPGNNLVLNINHDWQRLAYNALRDKTVATKGLGGAMTIIDVETGDVKVMVSYPTFDLNQFTEGISAKDYEALLKNPGSPLMERNTGVAIPTGSIFKVFSGLILMQEEVVDDKETFYSNGCMTLPGKKDFCESFFRKLGHIDIYDAISLSSNIYFCESMIKMEDQKKDYAKFVEHTDEFGVGRTTEVDLPHESAGSMATPEIKWRVFNEPWYVGDSCNASIGQGFVTATPLQMAIALASLDNGGKIMKPHIVNRIQDKNGSVVKQFEPEVLRTVGISEDNMAKMREAMRQGVENSNGTVRGLQGTGKKVIAKTGTATAQVTINGKTYDEPHAWVMGIFERNGRKYAFVVNIAHGGWGAQATEVAQRVIKGI